MLIQHLLQIPKERIGRQRLRNKKDCVPGDSIRDLIPDPSKIEANF